MADLDLRELERAAQAEDPDAMDALDRACARLGTRSSVRTEAYRRLVTMLELSLDVCERCRNYSHDSLRAESLPIPTGEPGPEFGIAVVYKRFCLRCSSFSHLGAALFHADGTMARGF